jgi:hypothetical protein
MGRPLLDLFARGYRQVRSPLSPDGFIRSAAGFGFGVPWPWEEVPFDALEGVSRPPAAAVAAPRTDGRSALFLVTEGGPWAGFEHTDMHGMLRAFAAEYGARPERTRRVALDGARAQVLEAASGREHVRMLLVGHRSGHLQGLLRVPIPAYLHHFEVILATWRWLP